MHKVVGVGRQPTKVVDKRVVVLLQEVDLENVLGQVCNFGVREPHYAVRGGAEQKLGLALLLKCFFISWCSGVLCLLLIIAAG